MSDESISGKEDRENLLYISQQICVEDLTYDPRKSIVSDSSDTALKGIGSDVDMISKIPKDLGPSLYGNPEILAKTKPFELKWSFGLNAKVPIRNLTNNEKHQLIFASSHFPIIFDYCSSKMKYLEGHSNLIKCIASDKTGHWIVTVGSHSSGHVLFWDNRSEDISLVRTIFEPYPCEGVEIIQISQSARYFIMIGSANESEYSVDFWLWTEGTEDPNDSYFIPKTHGLPVAVCFNPDIEEHIMVVFELQVFLMVWDINTKKLTTVVLPQLLHKKQIGHLTDGTYVGRCHECFAVSDNGCILVFGNTLYPKPFEEGDLDNSKIFRNAIKVSTGIIYSCTTTDELFITCDSKGIIQFFDKKIRILYWMKDLNLGPIYSISFNLNPKFKYTDRNQYITRKPNYNKIFSCPYEDITEELELLTKKDLPEEATLAKEPFYVNDFLVTTAHSNIYLIDCVYSKCTPLFHTVGGYVSAIETHDELDYILIGYSTGAILLIDYATNSLIGKFNLPEVEEGNAVTCIKYSTESFHLFCGRENGEIWVLEPVLLTPKQKPFTITEYKVVKIDFSYFPIQFAYFDSNRTVVLLSYDLENLQWYFSGKVRSHYDEIHDIMFMPGVPNWKLYTISKDRHIVEYDNTKTDPDDFHISSRIRTDQSAIPICFTYWYDVTDDKQRAYIFVSDNTYKMKLLYQSTKSPKTLVLGPAYGCFKNNYIKKMLVVPGCESRYMVFSTKVHLGLHILPPDGSPYKYVGYLAHSDGLVDFKLSHDGKYVFSFAENDASVLQWEIKTRAVEIMSLLGGKELEPFYCLIEGGAQGSLFQEMKDLFYYMQILEQGDTDIARRVLDTISVSTIPDLIRSCGFYPSEFELETLMIDIRNRNFDENELSNEEINFIDFVKLYCNHKPAYGYSLKEIENAFLCLAERAEDYVSDYCLSRDEIIEVFTNTGEPMSANSTYKCFKTLLRNEDFGDNFNFIPDVISFELFREDILGVDMFRDKFQEDDASENASIFIVND